MTEAAKRLLTPLFQMGLSENPYVDEFAADKTVGNKAHREVGLDVQRKSAVLLQNRAVGGGTVLPLKEGSKVYILGDFNYERVASYGYTVVNGNAEDRPSAEGSDYVLISMTAKNVNTNTYVSNSPETGLNPDHINPIVMPGVRGLTARARTVPLMHASPTAPRPVRTTA